MISTVNVFGCAAIALVLWTGIGFAVARHIVPGALAWSVAPVLGWAVHSAILLPVFLVVGFRASVIFAIAMPFLAAVGELVHLSREHREKAPFPAWALAGAAVVALIPLMAVLPKTVADGVTLAAPIFDHAKIAMIDEMVRLGVPPGNPFFGGEGSAAPLSYYYLWHLSAAALAAVIGVSGWEADAALTWFTAFATLALMTGLASWFSGRAVAAAWVLVLTLTVSARPVLAWLAGPEAVEHALGYFSGLAGLLFQASWAPQHVTSAACVVLAVVTMSRMRESGALGVVTLALVVAAAVESSTWVGGVLFAIAAPVCAVAILLALTPAQRTPFLVKCAVAAVLAIALAYPMLRDQYVATAMRGGGAPIVVQPWEVIGPILPETARRLVDLPAYWLVLWVVELPAIYLIGLAAMTGFLRATDVPPDIRRTLVVLAALALTAMAAAWLLVSTVGTNNDFGWRAALPAIMVLTSAGAAGMARWITVRHAAPLAAALALVALGLPDGIGFIRSNVTGLTGTPAAQFAQAPAMWAAVRRNASATDRVANNPLFLKDMTLWPVNISWALMANRPSCYAGAELAIPFVPLPETRRKQIDDQFLRVFAGTGTPDDIQDFAFRYNCRVIVVRSDDGAWARDPFAGSPFYRLLETETGKWRIYGRVAYARN